MDAVADKDRTGWFGSYIVGGVIIGPEFICGSYDFKKLAKWCRQFKNVGIEVAHLRSARVSSSGAVMSLAQPFTAAQLDELAELVGETTIWRLAAGHGQVKRAADLMGNHLKKANGEVKTDQNGRPVANKPLDSRSWLECLTLGLLHMPTARFLGAPAEDEELEADRAEVCDRYNAWRNGDETSDPDYIALRTRMTELCLAGNETALAFAAFSDGGKLSKHRIGPLAGQVKLDREDEVRVLWLLAEHGWSTRYAFERVAQFHNYGRGLLRSSVYRSWQKLERRDTKLEYLNWATPEEVKARPARVASRRVRQAQLRRLYQILKADRTNSA